MSSKSSKKINNGKILVIVESPAKCSKIESYLGPNYKCIASNENRTHYLQFTRLVPHHYGPRSKNYEHRESNPSILIGSQVVYH